MQHCNSNSNIHTTTVVAFTSSTIKYNNRHTHTQYLCTMKMTATYSGGSIVTFTSSNIA